MGKNFAILILVVVCGFLAYRLADVERQRYALLLGQCPPPEGLSVPDVECLKSVQPRIHAVADLAAGALGAD